MVFVFLTILFFFFSGIFDKNAYAYLDPGTGSYIFQILIATLIGALFAVKMFWRQIVLFFKNLFLKKEEHK
jgi:hypothetical protein